MSTLDRYDKQTIFEFYTNQMYTQGELAEMYGVSRTTIRRAVEDHRISLTKQGLTTPERVVATDGHGGGQKMATSNVAIGLLMGLVATGMAGFVGWIIYHAIGG